ncbi:MAG: hypothetical protein ABL930_03850 [Pseudobdellovibrio sp.]
MMSQNFPIHKIEIPEAVELASYSGFFQDLTFTCDTFRYLLDNFDQLDTLLQKSLWSTALISYARCFAHGRRLQLTPSIYDGLEGDPHGCHEYIIGMRNKHIAHSVNPFEEISAGAVLINDQVEGIATIAVSHFVGDKAGVENLYRLTIFAREFVAKKCRELQDKCLIAAKQIPVETIKQGADLRYVAPSPEAVNQVRGRNNS